jgi:hypothetical protein
MALSLMGLVERFMNLKLMVHGYEVTGGNADETVAEINGVLEPLRSMTVNLQVAPTPRHVRVRFECEGTRKQQAAVLASLRQSGKFQTVTALGPVQAE